MNANSLQTTHNWLASSTQALSAAGIATANLDALVLLEDCLKLLRANILAHPEHKLTNAQFSKLNKQVTRRITHEPLAYIRGKTEFYGREFLVNSHTLEPRPETEIMIDVLKKLKPQPHTIIADIGTGSGAIAITTQLEFPTSKLLATDISERCIATIQKNMKRLGVEFPAIQGHLLEPFQNQTVDILMCNLPYVPDDFGINKAALHEPRLAIFGGKDGLDLYRSLFEQIAQRTQKPRFVLTESLPTQHQELENIARKVGYKLQVSEDFVQAFTQ